MFPGSRVLLGSLLALAGVAGGGDVGSAASGNAPDPTVGRGAPVQAPPDSHDDPAPGDEPRPLAPLVRTLYQPWSWTRFDALDGLPSANVRTLVEDLSGTPWAVTDRGVAWFDGYRWHGPRDGGARNGTCIEGLGPTEDGLLVVYCDKGMRVTRDGAAFNAPWSQDREGPPGPVLSPVCGRFDGETVTAVPAGGGGLQADLATGELRPFDVPHALSELDAVSPDRARSWLRTRAGYTTWRDGVPSVDYPLPETWQVHRATLLEDGTYGVCVIGTPVEECGLHEWVGDGPPRRVDFPGLRYFRAMALHPSGDCVALSDGGIFYVREDGEWTRLPHPLPNLRGITDLRFRDDGDLWCSTTDGLFLLHRQPSRWTHGLEGDRVRPGSATLDVQPTRDGSLWFATSDALLRRGPDGTVREVLGPEGHSLPAITTLHEDARGTLWVGSGARTFDGLLAWRDGAWEAVGAAQGLTARPVHAVRSARDGTLWALEIPSPEEPDGVRATFAHGLRDGRWVTLPVPRDLPGGRTPYRWYDLVDDGRGSLWVATDAGLLRYDADDLEFTGAVRGTGHERVYCLAVDDAGQVWFGHQVSRPGLGRVNPDLTASYARMEPGSLPPFVNDLAFDAGGRLWIATEDGLMSHHERRWDRFLDPRVGATGRNYRVLPLGDRVLLAGTGGGTSSLDLDDPVDAPPQVDLFLPAVSDGHVHVRVQAASFWGETPRERLWTRHRLDGGPWSPWGQESRLELHARPGEHELEVEARGPDGVRDTGRRTARFRVERRPEISPWVVAGLTALLLVSSGAALVSLRRKRLQDAELRESEGRFRQLTDTMAEVFWLSDRVQRRMLYISPGFERITGRDRARVLAGEEPLDACIHPDDIERVRAGFDARAHIGTWEEVFRIVRPDGTVRWVRDRAYPIRDAQGRVVRMAGMSSDVTEQQEARQRQELMRRELDHRVKNTLAGVLALTDHGSEPGVDVETYRRTLTGRVRAMARAHELLSAGRWSRVAMRDLVELVVLPYVDPEDRARIEGEALFVSPATCTPLAMALHELTTNALKYGALSVADGTVELSWCLDGDVLHMLWRESGGPEVTEPVRPGLGLSLVRGVVEHELDGRCTIDFPPTGLTVELAFSLEHERPDPA